jgi:hypothetical protein
MVMNFKVENLKMCALLLKQQYRVAASGSDISGTFLMRC